MIAWADRTHEEKALLNPSFTALLLWHAAKGHYSYEKVGLPLEEAFLVLPIVLHQKTRESLPGTTRTSLAMWLESDPLTRGRVSGRARAMMPYTKEAILFGGVNLALSIHSGHVYPISGLGSAARRTLLDCSEEVQFCAKKSEFLGKWFAKTGNSSTVMALVGVRP